MQRPAVPLANRRSRFATLSLALAAALAGCGELPPVEPRGSFSFGVFGDGPYRWNQMGRFDRLIEDVNRADVAFLIHIGDVLWYPCSDQVLLDRRDALAGVRAPVVYTPGDNEWTDCHERIAGGYDPLERLDAVRRIFFAEVRWSGVETLRPVRQSADTAWARYVENVRWEMGDIVFATLHVVGSENGLEPFPGRSAANDAEARERMRAGLAWMAEAFGVAATQDARAVVLAMHANPGFDGDDADRAPYAEFLRALAAEAAQWDKPVLLIHGDWHELHIDRPLVDSAGDTVRNVLRLETFGSPDIGWVNVVVDTTAAELFAFEPRKMPRRMIWW